MGGVVELIVPVPYAWDSCLLYSLGLMTSNASSLLSVMKFQKFNKVNHCSIKDIFIVDKQLKATINDEKYSLNVIFDSECISKAIVSGEISSVKVGSVINIIDAEIIRTDNEFLLKIFEFTCSATESEPHDVKSVMVDAVVQNIFAAFSSKVTEKLPRSMQDSLIDALKSRKFATVASQMIQQDHFKRIKRFKL